MNHEAITPCRLDYWCLWRLAWLSFIPLFGLICVGCLSISEHFGGYLLYPEVWPYILGALLVASFLVAGWAYLFFGAGRVFTGTRAFLMWVLPLLICLPLGIERLDIWKYNFQGFLFFTLVSVAADLLYLGLPMAVYILLIRSTCNKLTKSHESAASHEQSHDN